MRVVTTVAARSVNLLWPVSHKSLSQILSDVVLVADRIADRTGAVAAWKDLDTRP